MKKTPNLSRREFMRLAALASAGVTGLVMSPHVSFAQTPEATPEITATPMPALPPAPAAGPLTAEAAGGMDALVAAAVKEGALSVIAVPDEWANYVEIKAAFKAKYPGIATFNDLLPEVGSGDEIGQIQANAGNTGPQNPDVIDVGFTWGKDSKDQGLLQPYKVATWDTIPDTFKDADGYWYGDYYGKMSFEVNADVVTNVPQDWSDLLKPEYKGLIALAGDPNASNQAASAVWASGLANGGTLDDPMVGLQFFKQLAAAGNLNGTIATSAKIVQGETPIVLRWDYIALGDRDASKDSANIQVIYPKSGTVAGGYVQAINAYAPRPFAARVWEEYLYSDEGQLLFLKGYATPARFDDLKKRNVIPADLLTKLPTSNVTVTFPSYDQISKSIKMIYSKWNEIVGVTISA